MAAPGCVSAPSGARRSEFSSDDRREGCVMVVATPTRWPSQRSPRSPPRGRAARTGLLDGDCLRPGLAGRQPTCADRCADGVGSAPVPCGFPSGCCSTPTGPSSSTSPPAPPLRTPAALPCRHPLGRSARDRPPSSARRAAARAARDPGDARRVRVRPQRVGASARAAAPGRPSPGGLAGRRGQRERGGLLQRPRDGGALAAPLPRATNGRRGSPMPADQRLLIDR